MLIRLYEETNLIPNQLSFHRKNKSPVFGIDRELLSNNLGIKEICFLLIKILSSFTLLDSKCKDKSKYGVFTRYSQFSEGQYQTFTTDIRDDILFL